MNVIRFLVLLLFSVFSFSQENWQSMMFDQSNNFNDIVEDFNKYYNLNVQDQKQFPKGIGIKQFKRWEYYWSQRVDQNGNFPKSGNLLQAYQEYLSRNVANRYATGSGNWQLVGPTALPYNGTIQLNGNGRLNCIAFHPIDPNIIFVGAPSGGVWKTTDNGMTWRELSSGLIRLGVSSIVIHPTNPDIIYIGTGDRDAGDALGYGVWRSTDGGQTWTARNTGMGNVTVNEVMMDPTNSNRLIAAASNGRIYRTTDGGANWSQSLSLGTNPKDIAFHPTDSNIIYASSTRFYKSIDGGATFTQITSILPTTAQRMAIAVSPNQPNWVYLLAGGSTGLVGIYRSTDSGTNFSTQTTTPNILGYNTDGSGTGSQAWYDLVLVADPTNADIIYTGGVNLWKSTNGGTTMTCVSHWVAPTSSSGGIEAVHADQHALEFSPHTNVLYNGNDGGLYYTTNGGAKWVDVSSGLAIAQVYKIGVSQQTHDLVINGYQDNGTGVSRGTSFITEIGGDGMECIIDPTDDNFMYGALYYGDIRRSTNAGLTFSGNIAGSIPEQGAWVTPYKLDPNNVNTMFAGFDNIWRNTNVKGGTTWTQISSFGGTQDMVDLAIAPSNSNVMYVSRNATSRFYKSINVLGASPTWTDLSGTLPAAGLVKDIEIDPTNPDILYIAIGNKIYRSTNGGTSWTDFSTSLPNISLNTIVIDKTSTVNAMYVGMDVGVYYRDNNLAGWVSYSNSLSNVEITELEIHYNTTNCNSKLYASTYGQGLWVSDLKDPGNVAPVACFDVKNTVGCIDNIIQITDNSNFSPTSWTWTITPNTFSYANGTNANSPNPEVNFTASGNYTIQLLVSNAFGSNSISKVVNIQINGGTAASNFNQNFESQATCGTTNNCGTGTCNITGLWTNLTNGTQDEIDWRIDINGTPTTNTGPATDFNPGTTAGKYAYLEATSCGARVAILESQCILLDQKYTFEFAYHMFGNTMGSLHVDVFRNGVWIENFIPAIYGDKGNQWNVASINLYDYEGETIKIRIRGVTGFREFSDLAIDDIKFVSKCSTTTIWDGTAWNSGAPDIDKSVVINGNYNTETDGNIECCSMTVNTGFTLNINDSNYILVVNNLTVNGVLNIRNNGSLIQTEDTAINTGSITYERTANIRKDDYVFWSSPISGFVVENISPNTPNMYKLKWDTILANSNGGLGDWAQAASDVMEAGKGYIVRGPNTFTTTPQNYTAIFSNGIPNNGVITTPISRGDYQGANYLGTNNAVITRFSDNWNLVGNPYPSSINVMDFLNLNTNIEGAVRIWTHNTAPSSSISSPFYGSYVSNYSPSDYITYNGMGTVSGPVGFNGLIAGGQGFMINMIDGPLTTSTIEFNNSLRGKSYANNQFYRNTFSTNEVVNRIWIDLANIGGNSDRTLIGYTDEATNEKDRLYDAVTSVGTAMKIYTLIENDRMTIQGRGLPFNLEDTVVLGVNIPTEGTYTIAIAAIDGLFLEQDIFLKDKNQQITHNIKEAPYVFSSVDGIFDDRFEIIYQNGTLSSETFISDNNAIVYISNNMIHINSSETISEISVFDVLGRNLYQKQTINNTIFSISSLNTANQTLLVKIKMTNGAIVNKKIIF
jgi:photosystem II stability/assembly factor-like uncharacterized protein